MKSSLAFVLAALVILIAACGQQSSSDKAGESQTVVAAATEAVRTSSASPKPYEPEEAFSICGGAFRYGEPRALKEGQYYGINEVAAIELMSRKDKSYWIVNFDDKVGGIRRDHDDSIWFEMSLLDADCLKPLGDFVGFPSRCIKKKEWHSWTWIRNWLKEVINPKDYADLIKGYEDYLRKQGILEHALKSGNK